MSEREPGVQAAVLAELAEAWKRNPRLRLCQLLVNVIAPETSCPELFYIEDGQLLEKLMHLSGNAPESAHLRA